MSKFNNRRLIALLGSCIFLFVLGVGVGVLIGSNKQARTATILTIKTDSETIHLMPDPWSLTPEEKAILDTAGWAKSQNGPCPAEVGSFTLPDDDEGITLIIKRHRIR